MPTDNITAAIHELRTLLSERLTTGESILAQHGRDEAHTPPCPPDAVAFPNSTQEVAEIMKICTRHCCPVIPYGIGTSLEGHIIPVKGGISIDTHLMNQVLQVNDSDMDAIVQPGVTREQLNQTLRATGLMFTVDPGANATIGGMTATRASGTNTVRYGSMRENVLALEVVLANGDIIRTGTRARKSSAGYDLTRLFVGSEGTLGIITQITVRLFGRPEHVAAATCAFDSVEAAVNAVIFTIQTGIPIARIELLDALQMQGMNIYNPDLKLPEKPHLFLEFHGTESSVMEQIALFQAIAADFKAENFQTAQQAEDRQRLWKARHHVHYACKALRPGAEVFATDCCVPISALAECIAQAQQAVKDSGLIAPLVGHVGDGNFHLALMVHPDNEAELQQAQQVADKINHITLTLGGTVTGEHGIGIGKRKYMTLEHGDAAYALMKTLKQAIDPLNIMNPGKMV